MIDYIEYDDSYREKLIKFIISIYVKEFGYAEAEEELLNLDMQIYKFGISKFLLAIDENNEIIGCVGIDTTNDTETYLKKMYVKREYRGSGIANELMSKIIQYAKEKNIKRIYLSTYKKLIRANGFYKKHKFIQYENDITKENSDVNCYYLDLK